jgi:hypothetical protein
MDKLSLWSNLMTQFDVEHGETIYGSTLGLELIHASQNPDDCRKAKYVVSAGWPYGFGSRIHMEGIVMGIAMMLGRVYMPHPDGDNVFWETHIPFCETTQQDSSLNCFYERATKCTITDAIAGTNYGDVNAFKTFYMGDFQQMFTDPAYRLKMIADLEPHKGINVVLTHGGQHWETHAFIPHQFYPLLRCSPIPQEFYHYWWRAVSLTYLLRPNEPTRRLINSVNLNTFHADDAGTCVAMFVRHGDKGIEMQLIDFPLYANATQYLWDHGLVPAAYQYLRKHNLLRGYDPDHLQLEEGQEILWGKRKYRHPTTSTTTDTGLATSNTDATTASSSSTASSEESKKKKRARNLRIDVIEAPPDPSEEDFPYYHFSYRIPFNGTMFITTEDPKVLEEAEAFGKANHWKIVYTNLFDRSKQTAYKTWDEQHKRGTVAVHDDLEYVSMLLNLLLSTTCESWVCTLPSNSCRVMDEFRATVGGKANRFYADIAKESCDDIPCVAGHHGKIKSFGE